MPNVLDEDFSNVLAVVFGIADSHPAKKILDQWVSKLLNVGNTPEELDNRNAYARRLLNILQRNGQLEPPFNRPPPDGPLEILANISWNQNGSPRGPQQTPSPGSFRGSPGSPRLSPGSSRGSPGKFYVSPGSPRVETSFSRSNDGYATHSKLVSDSGHSLVIEDLHVNVPTSSVLTDHENELCDIVDRMARSMNVFQFLQALVPHLEDKGEGLNLFMGDELSQFRAFVVEMFDSKNQYYGDMMGRHQTVAKKQFNKWIKRLEYFLRDNHSFIATYAPNCNWEEFLKNPNYFEEYFEHQIIADEDGEIVVENEGDSYRWRAKNFHKLLFLRSETKGVQEHNDQLRIKLDNLQRQFHDLQTIITMHEQMKHEKSSTLQAQLREEREKKNRYDDQITILLEKMGMRKAT